MLRNLDAEKHVHGKAWSVLHNGYFSNPLNAKPLLQALCSAAKKSHPALVADLGGGTGFLLEQLAKKSCFRNASLLNIDISAAQLRECVNPRIARIHCPLEVLQRKYLCQGRDAALMLMMRSVLHYFGDRNKQTNFLRRLRALARTSEYFVHQSACFDTDENAALMNKVYHIMHTDKSFLIQAELMKMLNRTGWDVESKRTAPRLAIHASELKKRYNLTETDIKKILAAVRGSKNCNALKLTKKDFVGFFEYSIFVCRAR